MLFRSPSLNPTKYHGEGPPRTSGLWRIDIECATSFFLFFPFYTGVFDTVRVGSWHIPLLLIRPIMDLQVQRHLQQDPMASINDKDHLHDSILDMPAATSHFHHLLEDFRHHDIRVLAIILPEPDTHRLRAKPNM